MTATTTKQTLKALTQGKEPKTPCKGHAANLETIKRAAAQGDLALVEMQLKATGERLAVLTALNHYGDSCEFVPLAALFNGNPYEMLNPPNPDGGFFTD